MTGPKTYVSKPSEIEAMQLTDTESLRALERWMIGAGEGTGPLMQIKSNPEGDVWIWVEANKGWLQIENQEWVAKDDHGFYPIKDDVFSRKYEPKNLNDGYDPLAQAIKAVNARNHPMGLADTKPLYEKHPYRGREGIIGSNCLDCGGSVTESWHRDSGEEAWARWDSNNG